MKKMICLFCVVTCCLAVQGQTQVPIQKKTRHIAAVDDQSVSARKISVLFTDGLKAFYSGNTGEALKIFNGIILDDSKHDASYYMLSKIYTDKKMYHEAANELRQAIAIDKENIWYKVDLANLYMDMEEYASAVKLWEQICKIKTNNEYYLYTLSDAYLNLNKYEKVIDTYNRMEKIIGYNDELTKNKAALWLYMDKVSEAVGEYDKMIALFPHNAEYYVKAGNICQTNGRMEQAMSYYAKAIVLNPDDAQLNLTLASYWEQKGDSEKQKQYMLQVFRNPSVDLSKKIPFMRNLLKNAINSKDVQQIQQLDTFSHALIQAHPTAGEGYAFQAGIYVLLKQYAEAKTYFEEAFKRDNTSFSTWEDYGYVLERLNQIPEILKYEQEITELFPNSAYLLCYLGRAYVAQKQADKALTYLKQALAYAYEQDQLARIYEAMGDAYQLKGESDKALDYWKKAQQKGINSPALLKKLSE